MAKISDAEVGKVVTLRAVILSGPNSQGHVPVGFIGADGIPWQTDGGSKVGCWYLYPDVPPFDEQKTQSRQAKALTERYATEVAVKAAAKAKREARRLT